MAGIERIVDAQTQYTAEAPQARVDHAASARSNLAAMRETLASMRFDHTFAAIATYAEGATMRDMRDHFGVQPAASPELTALKGLAMLPVGLLRDALEVALAPVLIVKDGVDAAWHGLLAGFGDAKRA